MGYKTERKDEILSFFENNFNRAFSVREVCETLLGKGGGESSVYRIISDYTNKGLLKRITDIKGRENLYQFLGKNDCSGHLHLKCAKCGSLIHLSIDETQAINQRIFSTQGFSLDNNTTIFGTCRLCGKGSTSDERTL